MADRDKLLNQIIELRFTSRSLQRQAQKCEKEEKSETLKVKKAMEKSNMEGARLCAENSIRKRTEQLNYMRLSSRLDAVISQFDTQAKMMTINRSLGSVVKTLDAALDTNNLLKMSETLDEFEKQFANMEVQAQFVENAMAGSTSLSTPDVKVNELMQQVADEYGLQISVGLPQAGAQLLQEPSKVPEEGELSRRFAELKGKG